jgi:hypothetical protein
MSRPQSRPDSAKIMRMSTTRPTPPPRYGPPYRQPPGTPTRSTTIRMMSSRFMACPPSRRGHGRVTIVGTVRCSLCGALRAPRPGTASNGVVCQAVPAVSVHRVGDAGRMKRGSPALFSMGRQLEIVLLPRHARGDVPMTSHEGTHWRRTASAPRDSVSGASRAAARVANSRRPRGRRARPSASGAKRRRGPGTRHPPASG